jgi:aminoglycoside phosphotransferase
VAELARQPGAADRRRGPAALVPVSAPAVRDGRWALLTTRSYGTTIYRVDGAAGRGAYYVKATAACDPDDLRFSPAGEAARLTWLSQQGFPVPEVVEVGAGAGLAWLVTTAIEGRSAALRWSAADQGPVLDVVADFARTLHGLPAAGCPFDRTLAVSLPRIRAGALAGRVDLDDLCETHAGWTAQQLLDELDATQAPAEEHIVVCHGDLSLDNILIAPDVMTLAGVLDAGRLGTADRWLDLALMLRNLGGECPGWEPGPGHTGRFLRRYGLAEVDEVRLDYYRLLDEFI